MGPWKCAPRRRQDTTLALLMLGCSSVSSGGDAAAGDAAAVVQSRVVAEMAAGQSDPLLVQTTDGALQGVAAGNVEPGPPPWPAAFEYAQPIGGVWALTFARARSER